MKNLGKKQLVIAIAATLLALPATSAVKKKAPTKAKIKKENIAKILKSDAKKNLLVVRMKDGKIYKLNLSAKKIKEIEKGVKVASTSAVKLPKKKKRRKKSRAKSKTSVKKIAAKAKKEEKKSPWSGYYYTYFSSNVETFNDATGGIDSYNKFGLVYASDHGITYSIAPDFSYSFDIERQAIDNGKMGNITLEAKGKMADLGNEFNLYGKGRYIAPTSEARRDTGTYGEFYFSAAIDKQFNSVFGATAFVNPRYHGQTNRVEIKLDDFGRITESSPLPSWRFIGGVAFREKVHEKISLAQTLYIDRRWSYSDFGLEPTAPTTNISWDASISTSAIKGVSLGLEISQSHRTGGEEGFSFLKGSQSYYGLFSTISL